MKSTKASRALYTLGVYSPHIQPPNTMPDYDTEGNPNESKPSVADRGDNDFLNLTAPYIKTYAEKVGASYYHLEDQLVRDYPDFTDAFRQAARGLYKGSRDTYWGKGGRVMHGFWYKILVLDVFLKSGYDTMCFMDSDILIARLDYDIFEEMGDSEVFIGTTQDFGGLSNEGLEAFYTDPWRTQRDRRPPNPRMAAFVRKEKYHFSSGLFCITKAGAQKVIDSCKPYSDLRFVPYIHNGDQAFLSCKFWEHCKVKKMPLNIHTRPFMAQNHPEAAFLHFGDDPRSANKYTNIESYIYAQAYRYKRPLPLLDGRHGYPAAPTSPQLIKFQATFKPHWI